MRVPHLRFREKRNFFALSKIGLATAASVPFRLGRFARGGRSHAIVAGKPDFGVWGALPRSGRTVIDAESQTQKKPGTE